MHTGPLIMGITGDADRMDATTISDTVNTASRLESLTKESRFGARIICSNSTRLSLVKNYQLRDLGETEIRGKKGAIRIWSVDAPVD